jgi:hypothetical protein
VEHFKHSMHEMQQLLLKLQGLSIDADSTVELNRLLTSQSQRASSRVQAVAAAQDSPKGAGLIAGEQQLQQQEAGSTCSSNSSCVPPASLQQRLQREVLSSISELHTAITGMPLPDTDATGSPGTLRMMAGQGGSSSPYRQPPSTAAGDSMQSKRVAAVAGAGVCSANAAGPSLLPAMQASGVAAAVAEPALMQQLSARISEMVLQQLHDLQHGGGLGSSQPSSIPPSRGSVTEQG